MVRGVRATVLSVSLLGGGPWAWCAECDPLLSDQELSLLDLFTFRKSVQPGETVFFSFGTRECCYFWRPVHGCVEWSVDPAAAGFITVEPNPGPREGGAYLHVAPAVAHGTAITVRANVDSGRKVLEERFHVYTKAENPLVGSWRELLQASCPAFIRADSDGDGRIEITDAIHVLTFEFLGGEKPACVDAADATGDGAIDLADGVAILSYLFLGAAAPPAPFPACGPPPAGSQLGCERDGACAVGEILPETPIGELIFEADGTFSVTWTPFEVYRDYWGDYSFDLASGRIDLAIRGGNYIPIDARLQGGRFSIENSRLRLDGIWLGSPLDGPLTGRCGHVFR